MSKLSKIHSYIAEIDHRSIKIGSEIFISGGEQGVVVAQSPTNYRKAGVPFASTSNKLVYQVTKSKDPARVGTIQAQHEMRVYLKEGMADTYSKLFDTLDGNIRVSGYQLNRSGEGISEFAYNNWIEQFFRKQSVVPVSQLVEVIARFKSIHPMSEYVDGAPVSEASVHVGNEESDLFVKVYGQIWDGHFDSISQYRIAVTYAINRTSGYGGDMDLAELVDLYIKQYPFVVSEARSESTRALTHTISQVQEILSSLIPRPSLDSDVKNTLRDILAKLDTAHTTAARLTEDEFSDEEYIDEDELEFGEESHVTPEVPAETTPSDQIHPHRDIEQPEEVKPNLDWISNFDIKEVKNAIDEIVTFLTTCEDSEQISLLRNDIRILDNLASALKSGDNVDQHWEVATQQGSHEHLHPEFIEKMSGSVNTKAVKESTSKKRSVTFNAHCDWTDEAKSQGYDITVSDGDTELAHNTDGKMVGMWNKDRGWLTPVLEEGMDTTTHRIKDDTGTLIKVGDDIVWTDRSKVKRVGTVAADPKYTGGLKVDGRSLKNISDEASTLKVVKEGVVSDTIHKIKRAGEANDKGWKSLGAAYDSTPESPESRKHVRNAARYRNIQIGHKTPGGFPKSTPPDYDTGVQDSNGLEILLGDTIKYWLSPGAEPRTTTVSKYRDGFVLDDGRALADVAAHSAKIIVDKRTA